MKNFHDHFNLILFLSKYNHFVFENKNKECKHNLFHDYLFLKNYMVKVGSILDYNICNVNLWDFIIYIYFKDGSSFFELTSFIHYYYYLFRAVFDSNYNYFNGFLLNSLNRNNDHILDKL